LRNSWFTSLLLLFKDSLSNSNILLLIYSILLQISLFNNNNQSSSNNNILRLSDNPISIKLFLLKDLLFNSSRLSRELLLLDPRISNKILTFLITLLSSLDWKEIITGILLLPLLNYNKIINLIRTILLELLMGRISLKKKNEKNFSIFINSLNKSSFFFFFLKKILIEFIYLIQVFN
jgi:hypothetical protein